MKITSPVVGELDVAPDRMIEFPAGLPGFESCRMFTLLHAEGNDPKVFLLQSLDDADVVFSVTTPDILGLNYEFALSDEESASLKLDNPDNVAVLLIMRRNDGAEAAGAAAPILANLMAPLVINTVSRRGLQKIIGRVDASLTLRALA